MTLADGSLAISPQKRSPLAVLGGWASSPRVWTYFGCTAFALLASCLLGKDMNWDTLDYHFYAGFSALHDRFGMDYFPAGSQSYFNPYIYTPFYLLASSQLPAVVDAAILAIAQSGILWLTYELALQVAPTQDRRGRFVFALCSTVFAFANPILLNLFGSSYADVTTAELVLAGWLLLVLAVRIPSAKNVIAAGLLLGAASGLKLTNSVHAICAGMLLLFIPVRWSQRIRLLTFFGATLAISFALVSLPWSLRLQQHFGNPFFPLFNEIFRSPQFPTAPMLDYRFIPDSFREALWRPFAIAKPEFMIDDEQQSPDIRYAALLVTAILLLLQWMWLCLRHNRSEAAREQGRPGPAAGARSLAALGVAFTLDWILWLAASGNGRYFIAMACIAGVLAIALVWRLLSAPKIRAYLLTILFGLQFMQLCMGTGYRSHISWVGPWFDVRLPADLPRVPTLYLSYGVQSNAFIVPFLPPGSGFVNLYGDYPLAATGSNGAVVATLIHKYSPHVRVLARDGRAEDKRLPVISGMTAAADALLPFGLAPVRKGCSTIVVPNEGHQDLMFVHTEFRDKSRPPIPDREVQVSATGYLTTCPAVPDPSAHVGVMPNERRADLALDRLEDACPLLFQPARPTTQYYGNKHQDVWARRYLNTNLTAWVTRGWVEFVDPIRGGAATYIGPESAFERKNVQIICGRRNERYFATLAPSAAARNGL